MDYRQAEDYILSFTDYEKIPGIAYTSSLYDLRRMDMLLQPLGNPHLGTRTVHIAGTKGKGSTAAMITQTLVTAGYKTGMYTSPHLNILRERIQVDGKLIAEEEFADLVTEIRPVVEQVNREAAYGQLTTFEILTAVTFAYFKKKRVDFQVLEVGLGGRLDATNVVKPDVGIITSISLDHTEVLGDSIAKIAAEKAGIIKPGCMVVSAPQQKEAADVIGEICRRQKARLIQVGMDVTWRKTGGDLSRQTLTVHGKNSSYNLTIPLLGDHQLENAATAVAALEILASMGTKISTEHIKQGLRQVQWPGRMQVLRRHPLLVADGAHNADSMRRLAEAVKGYLGYDNCIVIFGTSCDKDISGMLPQLKPVVQKVIITGSHHPRAASISILAQEFGKLGIQSELSRDVPEALSRALGMAKKTDLILVTGSLFVVAETISWCMNHPAGKS